MGPDSGQSQLPKKLWRTLYLFFSVAALIVGVQGQSIEVCAANAVPPTVAGVTVQQCEMILGDSEGTLEEPYTLWYKRDNSTATTTLSFILSVPKSDRWYAMGFNPSEDSMPGTTAIIFWVDQSTQVGTAKEYHITNRDNADITSSTLLSFVVSPKVTVTSTSYLLAYEVQENSQMTYQNFAIGPVGGAVPTGASPFDGVQHDVPNGKASVRIDFSTGEASSASDPTDSKLRTHGILNIVGWGALLPLGAIIARYARDFDPQWFYLHAAFQLVGYVLILAGLITGADLLNDVSGGDKDLHKGLGIFVFILATIQISAVLLRPHTNHKLRRFWNWGHWWSGRIALVVAAVNVFVGIHLADAGRKWKVGYGIALAIEVLLAVILEARLWFTYAKRRRHEPRLPQTAMQRQGPTVNGNGPTAPPTYESTNWDG